MSETEITNQQKELIQIWQEVLEVDQVSIHSSYYDYGGDSLSAINLMLTMEKLGIEKSLIQDIINGRTIAQITNSRDQMTADATVKDGEENKYALIAKASEAINATRGFMVLFLVFIHWSPGVFERLSIDFERITNPLFRIGTPGFAIVFGLSVGFFFFSQFETNSKKARKNVRVAQFSILIAMSLLAAMKYAEIKLLALEPSLPLPTVLFYSVLLYYFLAVTSIPIWYRILASFENLPAAALCASILMFALQIIVRDILSGFPDLAGIWHLIGLMAEANYNYFFMSGIVFAGMSIGLYIRECLSEQKNTTGLLQCGFALIVLGILLSIESGLIETWLTRKTASIHMITTYLGVILIILSMALNYSHRTRRNSFFLMVFRVFAVLGLLSLPIYVGHGLVIPVKDVLVAFGVQYSLSLAASMLTFSLLIVYAGMKLYRLYYK